MDIFGIGITEILFIVVIVLIIFGPDDLVKNSGEIGKFLNKVVKSDAWQAMKRTTTEVKKLPTTLMREANLQDFEEERRKLGQELRTAINTNPDSNPASDLLGRQPMPPSGGPENRVAPSAQPPDPQPTSPSTDTHNA